MQRKDNMENELLESMQALIYQISNQFYNVEKEDLIQAGKMGLINAYKHYDKNSNTKFSSFAYTYIYGEMYNLSINSKSIKANRDTLKLVKLIEKTKNYLTQTLNKVPSISEIASYLEMDEQVLVNAYLYTNTLLSIDKEDNNICDLIKEEKDNDLIIDLKDNIKKLSKEEQDIIKYRYFNDLTQSETAKKLGLSQVKVSREESKSLKLLKKVMTYE